MKKTEHEILIDCSKGKRYFLSKGTKDESVDEKMNIATLNLNGETFFSINHRPRLPKSIFNIKNIKENLLALTTQGLKNVLENQKIDILAVQEFVNSKHERSEIEKVIMDAVYVFKAPKLDGRIHFVTGFIVKKKLKDKCTVKLDSFEKNSNDNSNDSLEKILTNNRKAFLEFDYKDIKFSILNIHVNNHTIAPSNKSTILLGDLNAWKSKQSSNDGACNENFLDSIECNYDSTEQNKTYTWKSNGVEKQLDHIYISKDFSKNNPSKINVDNTVNFYYNPKTGFTDHSMLICNFEKLLEN